MSSSPAPHPRARLALPPASVWRASRKSWVTNDLQRVGPWWMAWIWTALFCATLAAVFTALGFATSGGRSPAWAAWSGWVDWYGRNLIVTMTIGAIIHLLFDGAALVLKPQTVRAWPEWGRTLLFGGVPMVGLLIGWPLGMQLAGVSVMDVLSSRNALRIGLGTTVFGFALTFVMHHFFQAKTRQVEAERRATEAQLRLLQAQMEPHFLFNTLANVQSLIDHDPPRARAMLESFTDYLRATLTQLRSARSTLGAELAVAESYLQLLQTRMGDRLRYRVDVPDSLRAVPLPALSLQPLVENAVHHGLEPQVEGGTVTLRAHRDGDRLVIEVIDDGRGLHAPPRRSGRPGAGVALDNLRERLGAVYPGDDAGVNLAPVAPPGRGTTATLTVPLQGLTAQGPPRAPGAAGHTEPSPSTTTPS